ncbi:DUF4158 domain-containing protein [Streptomyces silvae]|uniref:DUF4158 domain-containing protein n=1 Tax=Streptomyces silvae TaxID=2803812 RepID=A0ABU8AEL0_9ACTN
MPVEFLTDAQAAAYAAYDEAPSRTELERFFFLDDADRELIEGKRRSHNRLGFAAQLTTARYLGVFLDDPTDVPPEVVDYLAEQLGIADVSALKAYGERENTRLDHVRELRKVLEYTEFAEAEAELRAWVDARAWTTGEGPKALFDASVGWLRERRVLLPGVTTLARLVASVREAANQRLWDSLYGLLSIGQRAVLDSLLTVPPGARVSELDRLRRGPVRVSGPQMKWALERAAEIDAFGMGELDVSGIPPRRLAELSRYGVDGKASLLRRHGDSRRLATLLATAVYLTSRAVDDALDLLEVLIATKLLARAERERAKQKLKTLPRMERAGIRLATAFRVVFDTTSEQVDTESGEISPPEVATLTAMWERIEEVVPREELAAAIAALFELAPPIDSDADEAWRTMLVTRFPTVRPFLALLVKVVDFGATPEGLPVLKALKSLPDLMGRKKVSPDEIDTSLLTGSWRRLVLSAPHMELGTVDWKAYVFCVLESFHRLLRRREVFAKNSSKWGDPRAKLLDGEAWEQVRPTVLASLNLPGEAGEHLAARAALLDGTYREVAGRVPANSQIVFDDDGHRQPAGRPAPGAGCCRQLGSPGPRHAPPCLGIPGQCVRGRSAYRPGPAPAPRGACHHPRQHVIRRSSWHAAQCRGPAPAPGAGPAPGAAPSSTSTRPRNGAAPPCRSAGSGHTEQGAAPPPRGCRSAVTCTPAPPSAAIPSAGSSGPGSSPTPPRSCWASLVSGSPR